MNIGVEGEYTNLGSHKLENIRLGNIKLFSNVFKENYRYERQLYLLWK
jgi:hypothetical protein